MTTAHTPITVYLGSSGYVRPVFKDAAIALGRELAARKIPLVYGGMDAGMMGLLANTMLKDGGDVLGVIPARLKDSERLNRALINPLFMDTFGDRKRQLFARSGAVIALPGGYGTIDEVFEAVYWAHLGLHRKPVIFLNTEDYWTPFIRFLDKHCPSVMKFLSVTGDVKGIFSLLEGRDLAITAEADVPTLAQFESEILSPTRMPIIIDDTSPEDIYRLVAALALKQLHAHERHIGVLNRNGQFDDFMEWVYKARDERFITPQCPDLLTIAPTEKELLAELEKRAPIVIDLHGQKWGQSPL